MPSVFTVHPFETLPRGYRSAVDGRLQNIEEIQGQVADGTRRLQAKVQSRPSRRKWETPNQEGVIDGTQGVEGSPRRDYSAPPLFPLARGRRRSPVG